MKTAIAFAVAIVVAVPVFVLAQSVPKRIFVSAIEASGRPVADLTAEDFQISEDGVKRAVTRVTRGDNPMRIVLMVDSSTATAPMMNNFRIALNAFVDSVPAEHEISFITTGGQIRVRTQPSADREKLRTEIGRFASEGGANAFLETMIESDSRFLKPAPTQWPVFVIVTTDNGDARREPDLARYNRFMHDFLGRGGIAHAVVLSGKQSGPITDLTQNLVQNTGGIYVSIVVDSGLADRLKQVAARLTEDHQIMADRYEVEFSGDAKLTQPTIIVKTGRDDVRLRMSPRRPF
jgi:archaellum component FlaG (FlaF/FlaG flagellin family)